MSGEGGGGYDDLILCMQTPCVAGLFAGAANHKYLDGIWRFVVAYQSCIDVLE